jgi:hypothetical protein
LSIVLTGASIDCAKDSREILQRTVATPINDALKWISNKFTVVHGQQGKLHYLNLPPLQL